MVPLILQAFQFFDIREIFLVLATNANRLEKEPQKMCRLLYQKGCLSVLLANTEFPELLDTNHQFIQLFKSLDGISHILLGSV